MLAIVKKVSGTFGLVSAVSSVRVDTGVNGQRNFLI